MALFRRVSHVIKPTNFRQSVAFTHDKNDLKVLEEVQEKAQKDMPIEMVNPFVKEKQKCLLCRLDVRPDFKNVRLLSQFVSRHTGRLFGRHITGLCEKKQKQLDVEIRKAQRSGLMPVVMKNPKYFNDPPLFDPLRPIRSHPF